MPDIDLKKIRDDLLMENEYKTKLENIKVKLAYANGVLDMYNEVKKQTKPCDRFEPVIVESPNR